MAEHVLRRCANCGRAIRPARKIPAMRYWSKDWREICARCVYGGPR